MGIKQQFSSLRPWFIWGLAAFFFFAHYVVRVTPGQISEELQAAFVDTTKYDIGILGASFYIPYVLMQMPVGYLVDRYGSRLLLTIAVLICSLSCLIFANASVFSMTIMSRVLLGFCSAAAFISALKLSTVWFEPKKLALLVGITQALGMVGASTGAGVVPYLTDALGWQDTFNVYAGSFLVLAVLMFAIIRDRPVGYASQSLPKTQAPITMQMVCKVIFNRYTWINACFAGLIYAPTDVMGELWGREFLKHIHGIHDSIDASRGISLLFIGWAIGGPLAGALADRIGRRKVMIYSAVCGFILLPLVFYVPHMPIGLMWALLFLYGFTNTGLIASYAAAGELHERELAGFSMAIANMFSVLVGALMMPLLGWLLQTLAESHAVGETLVYTAQDYQRATLVIPVCLGLAVLCAFFTKETLLPRNALKAVPTSA